jgi:hypothetical protein
MRLLLDEGVPRKIQFLFIAAGYECETVHGAGFSGRTNSDLLKLCAPRFDVLITIDKNMHRNMTGRTVALLILRASSNDISHITPLIPRALAALEVILKGQVVEVSTESHSDC